jgi:hypothetical protein
MSIDFTDFENADLVPDGTIAILQMRIRYGDATDGVLKRSESGETESLNVEYTIVSGPYARRKFWGNILLVGTTDGQKQMADRNKALLKAIIDSARGLSPGDKSPETRKARTVELRDFDGLRFQAEIGIEPESTDKRTGRTYAAKNVVKKAITRDMPGWGGPIEQTPDVGNGGDAAPPPQSSSPPPAPTPISKPRWAQ